MEWWLKKRLSQHLLVNKKALEHEANIIDIIGKTVVEIGAGDGRLSELLLRKKPKRLILYEIDRRFAGVLREKFDEKVVEVREGDFLKARLEDVDFIFGHIPYHISSQIIFRLSEIHFSDAVLIIQKEFFERMVAKPRTEEYGRLSVTSQLLFDVELLAELSPNSFFPRPKVSSVMIRLRKKREHLPKQLQHFIRKLFNRKNRMLRSIMECDLGVYGKRRPRELSPEEIVWLHEMNRQTTIKET